MHLMGKGFPNTPSFFLRLLNNHLFIASSTPLKASGGANIFLCWIKKILKSNFKRPITKVKRIKRKIYKGTY